MNRKVAIIIGLQAFLIILMFWVIVFYGKDEYEAYTRGEDEEIESPSRISTEHGATIVTLSPEAQAQSDIQTAKLATSARQVTLDSFGHVLDIESLIDLRTRYLAAKAEASVAQASLANTRQDYQRLEKLNQDDHNISDRALIAAQAQFKADQVKVLAAETAARNLSDALRQQWGPVLTAQAMEPSNQSLQELLAYREVLIRITFPFDVPPPKNGSNVLVKPTGIKAKPIRASFVSASPISDPTLQGRTYLYRAPAQDLRAGMRVNVTMASSSNSVQGVVVPQSAVVWYGGKAWVYKQMTADRFKREAIDTALETPDGWFDAHHLKEGDLVVVNGAQLLLSEEFRYQIKNENED